MTRDDIIRIAKEAGFEDGYGNHLFPPGDYTEEVIPVTDEIVRFAALVAAEKEQQMIRDGWRQCAKGQRTTQFCGLLDAAVKAEREACAKLCDELRDEDGFEPYGTECAAAIRARGET